MTYQPHKARSLSLAFLLLFLINYNIHFLIFLFSTSFQKETCDKDFSAPECQNTAASFITYYFIPKINKSLSIAIKICTILYNFYYATSVKNSID